MFTKGDRVRVTTNDHYNGMPATVVEIVDAGHPGAYVVVQMYGTTGESGQFHYLSEQLTYDDESRKLERNKNDVR